MGPDFLSRPALILEQRVGAGTAGPGEETPVPVPCGRPPGLTDPVDALGT